MRYYIVTFLVPTPLLMIVTSLLSPDLCSIRLLLRRSSTSITTQDEKSNKTQDNKTPVDTK